ncbi:hypothetical protein WA158_005513 [Blastocystis sp. Blastoise]
MAAVVPPFNPEGCRFDLTTYSGRVKYNFGKASMKHLFTSQAQIDEAKAKVEAFKNGTSTLSDEELWKAKELLDANVHPQTGATLNVLGRMGAFVPCNIPIQAGMLLAAPTVFNIVLWQWINQTYNAIFNYSNRNASIPQSMADIGKAYGSAVVVSVGVALAGNMALQKMKSPNPILRMSLPFLAVATAGVSNVLLMRLAEMSKGINVFDEDGNDLGVSIKAGKKAVINTAITRICIPIPVLLIPPFINAGLDKMGWMPKGKTGKMLTELTICTLCLIFALPCAIGVFPQTCRISPSKLEPQFQNLTNKDGKRIDVIVYDKGV